MYRRPGCRLGIWADIGGYTSYRSSPNHQPTTTNLDNFSINLVFDHGQTEANGRCLTARAKCKQNKLGPSFKL